MVRVHNQSVPIKGVDAIPLKILSKMHEFLHWFGGRLAGDDPVSCHDGLTSFPAYTRRTLILVVPTACPFLHYGGFLDSLEYATIFSAINLKKLLKPGLNQYLGIWLDHVIQTLVISDGFKSKGFLELPSVSLQECYYLVMRFIDSKRYFYDCTSTGFSYAKFRIHREQGLSYRRSRVCLPSWGTCISSLPLSVCLFPLQIQVSL